jgi:hypothetical protein
MMVNPSQPQMRQQDFRQPVQMVGQPQPQAGQAGQQMPQAAPQPMAAAQQNPMAMQQMVGFLPLSATSQLFCTSLSKFTHRAQPIGQTLSVSPMVRFLIAYPHRN